MSVVYSVKTVNFIRSKGLCHKQFHDLLRSPKTDSEDILYYCEVRWLSGGKMLEQFFKLKDDIQLFMEEKGKPVFEFDDREWI